MKWESRPRLLGAPNDAGLQHPLLDALPAGHLLNQGVDKSSKSSSRSQIHLLTPHVAKLAAAALAVEDSHLRAEEIPGSKCQVLLTTHLLHRLEGNGCQPPHHVGVLLLVAPGQEGDVGAPGEILITSYLAMSKWMYWILCSSGRNWLR